MRKLRLAIVWILISVVCQIGLMLYLEKYYFSDYNADDTEYAADPTATGTGVSATKGEPVPAKANISGEAKDIRLSVDGKFAAYTERNEIVVMDMKSQKELTRLKQGDTNVNYYRWLPDRNRLLTLLREDDGKKADFTIYYYDADNGKEDSVSTIENIDSDAVVEDIELSTNTNMIYVKFRTSEKSTMLYKFNIMSKAFRVYPHVNNIINMAELKKRDVLLYEDSVKQVVYVQEGSESWTIPLKKKLKLIGIDSSDMIYLAEMDKDNVVATYKGKLSKSVKDWERTELKSKISFEQLILVPKGDLYIKSDDTNALERVSDDKKLEYQGTFIEMLDQYIVVLKDGNLDVKVIE